MMTLEQERDAWKAVARNLGAVLALAATDERLDPETREDFRTAYRRQVAAHRLPHT